MRTSYFLIALGAVWPAQCAISEPSCGNEETTTITRTCKVRSTATITTGVTNTLTATLPGETVTFTTNVTSTVTQISTVIPTSVPISTTTQLSTITITLTAGTVTNTLGTTRDGSTVTQISTVTSTSVSTTTVTTVIACPSGNFWVNGDFEIPDPSINHDDPARGLQAHQVCDTGSAWYTSGRCGYAWLFGSSVPANTPNSPLSQTVRVCSVGNYRWALNYKITDGCVLDFYVEGQLMGTLQSTGNPSQWTNADWQPIALANSPLRLTNIQLRLEARNPGGNTCGVSIDQVVFAPL